METSIITKETIMPDGRPLFAWENELEILRKNQTNTERLAQENITFQQVMGIIYKHWQEPETMDWIFRVSILDAVTNTDFKYNLEKYLNREYRK